MYIERSTPTTPPGFSSDGTTRQIFLGPMSEPRRLENAGQFFKELFRVTQQDWKMDFGLVGEPR